MNTITRLSPRTRLCSPPHSDTQLALAMRFTKARIELQARLHDTNVSTAWPLAMARRAYDKCKAEFQEALKHLRHYSAILRNLYNEYAKYIIRNTYTA